MASPAQAFWRAKAVSKTAHEIKSTHLLERNVDKQARWQVRQNIVKDGVVSNLYDISIDPKAMAFYYDLDVTRRLKANVAVANAPANASTTDNRAPAAHQVRKSLPVSPTRAWRMYSQSLRRYPSLPPLVRVNGRVYAANALPSDVLTLPPEFHDLAWERCCLRPAGSDRLASLPPSDLKSVVNKMLPWALSYHARNDGSFAVVRQVDGKMVCTEDGISVAGLRIFRGTTATILHVKNGDILSASEDLHPAPPSLFLGSIANDGETVKIEFPVRCVELLRTVVAQGKPVAVYLVEDSSGKTVFRLWNAAADTMKPGQVYTIATVKTKAIDPSLKTNGSLRFEIQGSLPHTRITSVADGALAGGAAGETGGGAADASVGLALRLDTRCTVASEKSLWEEVRQHFGAGPYDADKQRMITRALQGTPVILSNSLKHTSVKSIRFDYVSSKDAPIDNELRGIDSQIDANQPYAVVNDFSVVPVQALHCCFDPRMRSWQEVTVPACSFMPLKRHDVLHKFRAALGNGLTQFGVHLAESPLGTKSLALLDAPTPRDSMAARPAPAGAGGRPSIAASLGPSASPSGAAHRPRFRTVAIVAIAHDRASQDEKDKSIRTAEVLGKYFRTQHRQTVNNEEAAKHYLEATLCVNNRLIDPDCVAIIVTPTRDSRASMWLYAECLRRGILVDFVRGASGDKRQKLVAEAVKLQLTQKYDTDPAREYNLIHEVPLLGRRTTLVVGVDACHTNDITTGCCAGMLIEPDKNHMLVQFWRNHVRGKEVEQVANHFAAIVGAANAIKPVEEVVVFQDGDVYSQLESMAACLPANANLSFLCLHKRTHIRFVHVSKDSKKDANVNKGTVVESLTPSLTPAEAGQVPSFYLQCHDCFMSTARTVQYKIHRASPQFPTTDLQKLSYTLAHVGAKAATKLPLPTRCAHKLSALAERMIDANPPFKASMIPEPLSRRMWFL
jgi:hypothetical protein